MKALGYLNAHFLDDFAIREFDIPKPILRDNDVLVEIKAISVNPVDTKIRRNRSATDGNPVILGWDASGVIIECGKDVHGFNIGDEIYYAGDLNRQGSNAALQAVDHRIIARKPKSLSFTQAAALPLTAITGYEMLFDQFNVPSDTPFNLLVIGGAGGVGSITLQLAKALTQGKLYATSGRAETQKWLEDVLQVDGVLDRNKPLKEETQRLGIESFDYIFSTTHTSQYLSQIADIIRPFGGFGVIDDPETLDIKSLKMKSARTYWEFMFAKPMYNYKPETQGQLLKQVADLVDGGQIQTTAQTVLSGLTVDNLHTAHRMIESQTTIGKIVIGF